MVDSAVKASGQNSSSALYEEDFYAWTREQAGLLKSGRLDKVDLANLIEEIETLGRKEVSELWSRYSILLQHLLKEIYQPQKSSRSWKATILNQRIEIARHMRLNPSLKAVADEIFLEAYADARNLAALETGITIEVFPAMPPFTRDQAVDRSWDPAPSRL